MRGPRRKPFSLRALGALVLLLAAGCAGARAASSDLPTANAPSRQEVRVLRRSVTTTTLAPDTVPPDTVAPDTVAPVVVPPVAVAPTPDQAQVLGAVAFHRVCPVTATTFRDDYGEPRPTGIPHRGNDLFAPVGTPNVAVTAGDVLYRSEVLGGLTAFVYGDDGNIYFYAHLLAYEGGERRVATGEVIGYTGLTGSGAGTVAHTHFEYRPGGGDRVDPYPLLLELCG